MNEDATTLEPQLEVSTVVGTSALEAIESAAINQQVTTAKKFPRNLAEVKRNMIAYATLDEDTAQRCFYTLPRGGKSIQGPSVRLAEIALACYQNLRAGSRILHVESNGDSPHVVVQAVCQDMQNNVAIAVEKRRRITSKKDWQSGGRKPIDEDDIQLAVNAAAAIAFREAVFKVVPGALIKPVFDAAKKVAVGDVKSLAEYRGKVIDRLKQMGITEDRILAAIQCTSVDEIDQAKLEVLIGTGTALKDGEVTIEQAFPPVAKKTTATFAAENKSASPAEPKHEQIKKFITGNGHTLDELIKVMVGSNVVELGDTKDWSDWDKIPEDKLDLCIRAKSGILTGLKMLKSRP